MAEPFGWSHGALLCGPDAGETPAVPGEAALPGGLPKGFRFAESYPANTPSRSGNRITTFAYVYPGNRVKKSRPLSPWPAFARHARGKTAPVVGFCVKAPS